MNKFRQFSFTLIRVFIAGILLYYLWNSGAINWSVLAGLGKVWHVTVLAIILLIIDVAIQSARLSLLMKVKNFELSVYASFRLTLIGMFFNTYMPGSAGGDLIKIYYAGRGNQGQRTEVATILLFDRAIGMYAMLILPLLIAPFFLEVIASSSLLRGILWSAAGISFLMLLTLLGATKPVRQSRFFSWILKKPSFGIYIDRMLDTIHSYFSHKKSVFGALLLSLIAQSLTVVIFFILAAIVNPAGVDARMALLIPLGLFANGVPITPGGLGVGEAAFDSLFGIVGLSSGAELLLSWRIILIIGSLGGLAYYLLGKHRYVSGSLQQLQAEQFTKAS